MASREKNPLLSSAAINYGAADLESNLAVTGDQPAPADQRTDGNDVPRSRDGGNAGIQSTGPTNGMFADETPRGWRKPAKELFQLLGSCLCLFGLSELRSRVRFLMLGTCGKCKALSRQKCCCPFYVPLKLIVQLCKIGLIIFQMLQFGQERSEIVEFFQSTDRTLEHLLLKDWEASYETMPYPPATGDFAVYTVDDVLDHVQYTWAQYNNMSRVSLAYILPIVDNSTDRPLPIRLCNNFNNYQIFPNGSYIVYPGLKQCCVDLDPLPGGDEYNIRTFLQRKNLTYTFPKLAEMTLDFAFTAFHLNMADTHWGPTCFKANATIRYTNYKRSGQLQISLVTHSTERTCTGRIMSAAANAEESTERETGIRIDSAVISMCIISLIACVFSVVRRIYLVRKVKDIGQGRPPACEDKMEFINPFWYLLVILGDVCTIAGSVMKIRLEKRSISSSIENHNRCSILLGVGGLMVCTGVVRYLNFCKECKILIQTVKSALRAALLFLFFSFVVFIGFLFCGWLVLAPYNVKFRSLSLSAESLYGLLNGDEVFVTFTANTNVDTLLWVFSRIYLYAFNSLFIIFILSIFVSIFTSTYETLKENELKKTRLQEWAKVDEHEICHLRCCCSEAKPDEAADQGEQPRAEEQTHLNCGQGRQAREADGRQTRLEDDQGRRLREADEQQPSQESDQARGEREGDEEGVREGDEELTRQETTPSPWRAENQTESMELLQRAKPSSELAKDN